MPYLTEISTLLTGVVAYFIGFIAVNSYLSQYAIVPFDFSQAKYVSAGLLYLATTALPTGIIVWVARRILQNNPDRTSAWAITSWAMWLLFSALNGAFAWMWPVNPDRPSWYGNLGVALILVATVLAVQGNTALSRIQKLQPLLSNGLLPAVMGVIMISSLWLRVGFANFLFYPFFLAALFLVYSFWSDKQRRLIESLYAMGLIISSIYLFGAYYYSNIPAHYGGGKPVLISLQLEKDSAEGVGKVLGREDWKCLMQNLAIVHENSDTFYALPFGVGYKEPAVAIRKADVLAWMYQEKPMTENYRCLE